MKIEDKLTASVINGVKELYGAEVPAKWYNYRNQEGV